MRTKYLCFAALLCLTADTLAAGRAVRYPSCNFEMQRRLSAPTGGAITDARLAHISMRANVLQADIGSARKARRLSQAQADELWHRVQAVREASERFVVEQGFLSAAERASFDREMDAAALRICR